MTLSSATVLSRRLGEALIEQGIITSVQRDLVLLQQAHLSRTGKHVRVGELLVRCGFATAAQVEAVMGTTHVLAHLLPGTVAKRLVTRIVAVEGDALVVESAQVLSADQESEILEYARRVALPVQRVLRRAGDRQRLLAALRAETDGASLGRTILALNANPTDAVNLHQAIEQMFADAVESGASDIHIDRTDEDVTCWISYRIHGDIRRQHLLTRQAMAAFITRLKIQAGMDPSLVQRSQDGRISIVHRNRSIDVRAATVQIDGGEAMTLRLLDPSALKTLDQLLCSQEEVAHLLKGIARQRGKNGGMVLLVGPTGTGKTTTLYATLTAMDRSRVNVTSVEDPVEYRLPLVRQIPVHTESGRTFAQALRSVLRHDPDVVMLGEMRDAETAEAALRLAASGHLLLSTLHATGPLQAIERLITLLDENYRRVGRLIVANHLTAIVAQSLVRRLCDCATEATPEDQAPFGNVVSACGLPADTVYRHRRGCVACQGTGYSGRIAVAECLYLAPDEQVRGDVEAVLLEQRPVRELLDIHGVTYIRRNQALARLLQTGIIDLPSASESMDLRWEVAP